MSSSNQISPAIIRELRSIVGEDQGICADHEKMKPYSHNDVADPDYAMMPAVVIKGLIRPGCLW